MLLRATGLVTLAPYALQPYLGTGPDPSVWLDWGRRDQVSWVSRFWDDDTVYSKGKGGSGLTIRERSTPIEYNKVR